jgi:hypothetical protein
MSFLACLNCRRWFINASKLEIYIVTRQRNIQSPIGDINARFASCATKSNGNVTARYERTWSGMRMNSRLSIVNGRLQLSGRVVDEEVIGALKRTGYMTPQHMIPLDAILTMLDY